MPSTGLDVYLNCAKGSQRYIGPNVREILAIHNSVGVLKLVYPETGNFSCKRGKTFFLYPFGANLQLQKKEQ